MASIRKTKKSLKKHQLFEVFEKGYKVGVVVIQFDVCRYLKSGIDVTFKHIDSHLFLPFTKIGSVVYYRIEETKKIGHSLIFTNNF